MKHLKIEVKTQTPYMKEDRDSYPFTKPQIEKLDQKHWVYFLIKADETLKRYKWEGRLYRAAAKIVKNWIEKDHAEYYQKNELLKDNAYTMWFNIPVKDKFNSTPWLKLIHTFPKEEMIPLRKLGSSTFSANKVGLMYKDYSKKLDEVVMKTVGDRGEFILTKYFESQSGVSNVVLNPQPYGAWDIDLDYRREVA